MLYFLYIKTPIRLPITPKPIKTINPPIRAYNPDTNPMRIEYKIDIMMVLIMPLEYSFPEMKLVMIPVIIIANPSNIIASTGKPDMLIVPEANMITAIRTSKTKNTKAPIKIAL